MPSNIDGSLRLLKLAIVAALSLGALAGCHGPPSRSVADAGRLDASSSALTARLLFSRPFGAAGEVPSELIAAGPGRLAVLTDQAIYLLDLDGRVLDRTVLPEPVRGAGGVSGFSWDGIGLALALRWRGDALTKAGTYLGFTDAHGVLLEGGMVAVAGPQAPLRSAFDGQAHQVVWTAAGVGLELHQLQVARLGQPSSRLLADGLTPELSLGELVASPAALQLCTIGAGGSVELRRFSPEGTGAVVELGAPGQQGLAPCRLAGSGRSWLLAWQSRAVSSSVDGGLKTLAYDQPLARVVSSDGTALAELVSLSAQAGTLSIESLLWDGARYLVLLDAASLRGGRLLLTVLDQAGRLLARDLLLPIAVEPGTLLTASLVGGPADYFLLYGLRQPWDEGILYLARFSLTAGDLNSARDGAE